VQVGVRISETRTIGSAKLAARLLGWNLDDETFASFVASPFEHGASSGRAHPSQEAVRAFPSNIAWLIRSFHSASSV
jgi:hypothetical protein